MTDSPGLSCGDLNAITSILLRERQKEIQHTHRGGHVKTEQRFEDAGLEDWSDVTKECWQPPESGRVKEEIPSRDWREISLANTMILVQ